MNTNNNQPITNPRSFWVAALQWIDRVCHARLLNHPGLANRARIFVFTIGAALLVVILSSVRDLALGNFLRIGWSVAAALPILLILRYFKLSGNLALSNHLFLIWIVAAISVRTMLNSDGSQVMVSVCTLGMIAAYVVSSRAGFFWTVVGTLVSAANAMRLTVSGSAEFEAAWAVTIMTTVIGLWSCAHALGREITRSATEKTINQAREERDRLRVFAERAFPGIIEVAPGRIDYASQGVTQLLGYATDEFVRAGLQEYVHPDDFWPVVETLQGAPNDVAQVEARLRHASGHWVWIAAFAIPYSEEADEDRWIFAARDVERERQNRELSLQAERLEGVGLLAAGVAHDFNNLLTVVAGHAELLPHSDQRHNILKAAEEASNLTSRLLSFSQEQPREVQYFDFQALLQDLQPILGSLLGEAVHLQISRSPAPCFMHNDATQLSQVLLNLVTNAKDAMPDGGQLTIEIHQEQLHARQTRELGLSTNNVICASIQDTGTGMDEETLARAFDPFFTTKEGKRGTGLGLASAYRLARRCGGHLQLTSQPNIGTTALLRLPAAVSESEKPVNTAPSIQSQLLHSWVLVVEDDAAIRQIICEAFGQIGVRTHAAADGEQALELYAQQSTQPALLVTDVIMPGMRGSVVADKLRLQQPQIKVLFISGYSDVKLDPWYEDDANVSFLAKPFRPSQLVQAATRLFSHTAS